MSKQEIIEAIKRLPEDVSFEDAIYHLYLLDQFQKGEKEMGRGNVYPRQGILQYYHAQ